jgi:hypothetical protein
VGLPVESLQRIGEAFGFARPEPGDAVVEAAGFGCRPGLRRRCASWTWRATPD